MTAIALAQVPCPKPQPDTDRATPEDLRLLAELRAGDAGAPAALHRRTHEVVRRTVMRLLGKRDDETEDVIHLAFIELARSIRSFRGTGPLDTWVAVVSSRVVYRVIRRRQLDRSVLHFVSPETLQGTSEVTTRDLVFRDALRHIRHLLAQVETKRSLTFLLHDIYGHDIREVARLTGISVDAAKTRLSRARREISERAHADLELVNLARELSRAQDAS